MAHCSGGDSFECVRKKCSLKYPTTTRERSRGYSQPRGRSGCPGCPHGGQFVDLHLYLCLGRFGDAMVNTSRTPEIPPSDTRKTWHFNASTGMLLGDRHVPVVKRYKELYGVSVSWREESLQTWKHGVTGKLICQPSGRVIFQENTLAVSL